MAWVRAPPENHPIFRDALPKDPRIARARGRCTVRSDGDGRVVFFGVEALTSAGAPVATGDRRTLKVLVSQ